MTRKKVFADVGSNARRLNNMSAPLHYTVGQGAAAQMMSHRRLQFSLPRYSAIIKDPDAVAVPDATDACMLIAYQLAHRTDKNTLPTLARYMKRFPRSLAMSYWRVLLSLDKSMMSTKTAIEWNIENAALYKQVMS